MELFCYHMHLDDIGAYFHFVLNALYREETTSIRLAEGTPTNGIGDESVDESPDHRIEGRSEDAKCEDICTPCMRPRVSGQLLPDPQLTSSSSSTPRLRLQSFQRPACYCFVEIKGWRGSSFECVYQSQSSHQGVLGTLFAMVQGVILRQSYIRQTWMRNFTHEEEKFWCLGVVPTVSFLTQKARKDATSVGRRSPRQFTFPSRSSTASTTYILPSASMQNTSNKQIYLTLMGSWVQMP